MSKQSKTKQFIDKAISIHSNKYGYDNVHYNNNKTRIHIYCKKCKKYFLQIPNNHLRGQGCSKCSGKKKPTTKEYIEKILTKYPENKNKYNYDKVVYINSSTKILIWCCKCKKYFKQSASAHLDGRGCWDCGGSKPLKTITFVNKVLNKYPENKIKYNYDNVIYTNTENKILIGCNKHKKYFFQTPHNHLRGQGCPICKESKGEKQISKCLDENDIIYETQKRFKYCKYKNTLSFDFYLPEYNICIEYQGEQHYKPVKKIGRKWFTLEESVKNYEKNKYKDKLKRKFCINNNITLIEIPYWEFKNIEDIIFIINTNK